VFLESQQTFHSFTNNIICIFLHFSFYSLYYTESEPGSSGSIVSGYGLDDRAIEIRSPAGAKDFSYILCVQTGSGAHSVSVQWVSGVKCGRGMTLATHPHLVLRSWMSRSYISSPPSASMVCSQTALLLHYTERNKNIYNISTNIWLLTRQQLKLRRLLLYFLIVF
jgi:hypothetical protein